tara:strand:- start:302 stop:733 length:432 start_codon:yes stop_codon:yes gene_type:complete
MNRKSRKAMTASTENGRRSGGGNSSTPGLEQAVEMSEGILPKELKGMSSDQVGPATRRLWPTPRASTGGADPHSRKTGKNLQHAVNWPTPVAGDSTKQPTNGLHHRVIGKGPTSHPGQLNPDWVEMLMGYPIGWTDCAPLETA